VRIGTGVLELFRLQQSGLKRQVDVRSPDRGIYRPGWCSVDRGEEPAAEGGVVIDVVAAGVSYADLLQTNGAYQMKVPLPFTPGMDAAGVVRSAPPDVGLVGGQRVAVLVSSGCWQVVISVPPERVVLFPG
jgi:NADPH:quinone reductase-like Zn-dependent oxidoreductase